jgi:hypothetical protein
VLVTQGFAPTVSTDNSVTVEPPAATLTITLFAPTVDATSDSLLPVVNYGTGSRQYGGGAKSRRQRRAFNPSEQVHVTDMPLPELLRDRVVLPDREEVFTDDRVLIADDDEELMVLVGLM